MILFLQNPGNPISRGVILCAALILSLVASAQTVTLSLREEPIEKVFALVEKQTGYSFIYSTEAVAQARPVTITVKAEPLEDFLETCFRNQPLAFHINNKYIIIRQRPLPSSAPAVRALRGRVLNAEGEGVAGATVTVKETGMQTVTDGEGLFQFHDVPVNTHLIVTGAEMETLELPTGSQTFLTISIKRKVNTLDETILIAYGNTTRRRTTGSVSRVSREEISRQPVSNMLSTLAGRVPGLQVTQGSGLPGTAINIRLRGQNSIANGNDPLYIIDGVPFPSLSLSSSFGGGGGISASPLSNINPSDIESIEILKDADATAIYGSRGANGVILISTKKGKAGRTKLEGRVYIGQGTITRKIEMLHTEEYLRMRREAFANDGVNPTVSNARDLLLWDTTRYTDWQEVLIGNTMKLTDLNLGVSGGNESTQFLFSTGYHKETTILPGNFGEEKLSALLDVRHKSHDNRMQLSVTANFLRNNNELPSADITNNITLPPNAPALHTAEGQLNWENSTWVNPFSLLLRTYNTVTDQLTANLAGSYAIMKGFEARLSMGFSSLGMHEHVITPIRSLDPGQPGISYAGFADMTIQTLITEPQLSYRGKWKSFGLNIVSGATIQASRNEALQQAGIGYLNDALLYSLKAAGSISILTDEKVKYRYAGFFTRLNLDYLDRYLLTMTGRRDGSSRYGPSNRFSNFGSLGAAWIFSREKFMEDSKVLHYGKIKASYGITGNDQIGDYRFLDTYSSYSYPYLGAVTLYPVQLFNPSFNWERVKKAEVGLDLGFFREKLLLGIAYFHNITDNQLMNYSLPGTTGFPGILRNVPARILNNGWEIELSALQHAGKHWKFSSSINLSIPKNKLIKYDDLENSSYANQYVPGKSIFISRRYEYTGIDSLTGNYTFRDFDRSGTISSLGDQRKFVFTGQQYFGGWQQAVSFKNIHLSFLVQFVRQKYTPGYLTRFGKPGTMVNQPVFVMDRWMVPGDQTQFQKFSNTNGPNSAAFNTYRQSDAALVDGSYIRMRNVSVSYKLPHQYLRAAALTDGELFIQAHNLFTITGYKGLDPETKSVVPPLRILTAGVHVTL